MVEIPDSARPYVDGFVKYHFWILAVVVPLVLLPSVFGANDALRARIQSQKTAIDGHTQALQTIQREEEHPNDSWVEAVHARAASVRSEILAQWKEFWTSQQPLRVWPQELGPDFLGTVQSLEDGQVARLPANLLQRYQNTIPDVVRTLPGRMGCKELMSGFTAGGEAGVPAAARGRVGAGAPREDDADSPEASLTLDPLIWRAEDQKRLLTSFVWHREPSTTQVRLAQEELWIYGLFCDAIHTMNAGATGAFNATITSVEELAVGFLAAEDVPGGRGGSRIIWRISPATLATPGEGDTAGMPPADPAAAAAPADGPVMRPSHPRFDGGGGMGEAYSPPGPPVPAAGAGLAGEGAAAAPSPDDILMEWIYVDFEGRPLTAAAAKATPDAVMVHLVPFTLRVVMDQRKIDQLLQTLAANPIPIDVRQVRINPSTQLGGQAGGLGSAGTSFGESAGLDPGSRRRRPFDVLVELRGSVGLATPPNEARIGGHPDSDEGPGGAP